METLKNQFLPDDMYQSDNLEGAWKSLDENESATIAQRVDLAYAFHLEEVARGKGGWMSRVIERLALEGPDAKRGAQIIADSVKVFKLFRTPAEYGGLGFKREELAGHSFSKLRVFAQNKDWSAQNKERIPQMLEELSSEAAIRAVIREERGITLKAGANDYVKMRFDLTSQDAANAEMVFRAMSRMMEARGEALPQVDANGHKLSEEYRRGILLSQLVGDWLTVGDSGARDQRGHPIPTMAFLDGGPFDPDAQQGAQQHGEQQGDDGDTQAA